MSAQSDDTTAGTLCHIQEMQWNKEAQISTKSINSKRSGFSDVISESKIPKLRFERWKKTFPFLTGSVNGLSQVTLKC